MHRNNPIVLRLPLAVAVTLLAIGCSKDDSTKPADNTPPGTVLIEAESFANSNDGGGFGITVPHCSGASGQLAVEGIDFAGDWIEVGFTLSEATCFSDSLRGEGTLDEVRKFAIVFYAGGDVVASDTVSTPPGKGFG